MKAVDDLHHRVANLMAASVPAGWRRAYLKARVLGDFVKPEGDYESSSGEVSWFLFGEQRGSELADVLQELRAAMKQPNKPAWSHISVVLEPSGKFHADFRYEDA